MSNIIVQLEEKVLAGGEITINEAMELTKVDNLDELFASANRIRENIKGKKVDLCTIMNAKSGKCSENCKFCAQSVHYQTGVDVYPLVSVEDVLKLAYENERDGAHRFSLVTSGKGITDKDFDNILEIYKAVKKETNLKLCASLGLISYEQAVRLVEVGVTMYHHNVETSRRFFPDICDTHTYEDRVETIKNVMRAGLDVCSGGIFGMGETLEDRINMAFEIKAMGVKSIPINILNPIKGTPLENVEKLDPKDILKTMAIYRFILPDGFIRYAGGRGGLGELQKLGFKAGINAALVGNYLTTIGNKIIEDVRMIQEEGLEV